MFFLNLCVAVIFLNVVAASSCDLTESGTTCLENNDLQVPIEAGGLNSSCAPGGNFDLTPWELQLPTGASGQVDTIKSSALQGCSGFSNSDFFTQSGDGALVMKVCGSPTSCGCVKTTHSAHCRTEFREVDPESGKPTNWNPSATTNSLSVTLAVENVSDGPNGTVIGQIHIDDHVSSKAVCELYYQSTGDMFMGVQRHRKNGGEHLTHVGKVPLRTSFSYQIRYEQNVLSVSIDGAPAKNLSTFFLDAPKSYFKVGNYNQGNGPSEVHFYAIEVVH